MEVTFGAVGDFISIGLIIRDIVTALNDSRGSAWDYRELIESLDLLERSLKEIYRIYSDPDLSGDLGGLRTAASDTARQITRALTEFRQKIAKYAGCLSGAGSGNLFKDAMRKVQWKLDEKDIHKFRTEIECYTQSLRMNSITEQSQNMRRLMADLAALFILGFQMAYQIGGELKQTSLFILYIGSTIYTELSGLHSLFTRLESSISEEYFTLQDAIGRTLPIHLRTITSWEDLGYIIQRRFEGMKGRRRVARHQYALEDHASRKELNQTMPWDHAFRPYQKVNMSILCKDSLDKPGEVPKRSCPWCRHLASGEESVEIKCENCNMFYRRVTEIEDIKVEKRAKYKAPVCILGRPSTKARAAFEKTTDVESESDEDDVSGLVRVRIIRKKRKTKSQRESGSHSPTSPTTVEPISRSTLTAPASTDPLLFPQHNSPTPTSKAESRKSTTSYIGLELPSFPIPGRDLDYLEELPDQWAAPVNDGDGDGDRGNSLSPLDEYLRKHFPDSWTGRSGGNSDRDGSLWPREKYFRASRLISDSGYRTSAMLARR
ncbi:hypothetical protein BKA56DRAFT_675286 [Ilyonectria sp. MPI-CAGE-AT-0026]|nr:hypothetical protein BKA56DRAFT_675286 [Ilyonectria sp. MPI-CAGE-AT-0026]